MELTVFGILLSSLATGIGALPVLFLRGISHRSMDMLLAYTAGVMVTASTYGIIPTALNLSNLFVLCCGVLIGALFLNLLEQFIPHVDLEHDKINLSLPAQSMMVATAMAFHNIPEGLSVGASFASQTENLGLTVALSIGLQNIPEGLLVALFLVNQKVNRWLAILVAIFTGVIELLASLLGFYLVSQILFLIPFSLAFAAGAMLFIVYKELIPETHGHGHERIATFAFLIGLLSMICLVEWFR